MLDLTQSNAMWSLWCRDDEYDGDYDDMVAMITMMMTSASSP